ncbi:alpha/beta hydrolase fold domain-containing protein [Microbacterium sp. CFBP9034]|uniref:alpha/beta hydrolase fold domain-containing protein n=1 Tax=Microbacterium sp. CFBP9034 TaxID=3096540 RepID=UPI002A6B8D8F|nr:alpha/beta hydrolase fold domain-containing protein [Microbacterium sp. CFBP9034]MDY0908406.1 alpha/beta hydrolase fold domain-containing protein [Microbacterium sp. CFBP9034]
MTDPYAAADGLVRVYPARAPHGAGLVWAHGGGFAGGDLDMPEADSVARSLASRGTTVVSVDYRLAGDGCRYPAPSDDILAAWAWAVDNAARLRVDPSRLAIGGASAGGNLVAGATLRLIERGVAVLPALVVLAYPTLLAVQPEPGPELRAALDADPDADRFGPDAVRGMYQNYLGHPVDRAPLPAVPGAATAADLAEFPPTLMINGDVDELRVSGEVFAATLASADRPIEVVTEPGTTHGHLNRPDLPAASVSLDRIATRLAALRSTVLPSRQNTPTP